MKRLLILSGVAALLCVALQWRALGAPRAGNAAASAVRLPQTATLNDECTLHVDNRSYHTIAIYVKGDRVGTVDEYGDLYIDVPNGHNTLEGRATCCNFRWGPVTRYMKDSYAWTLNP
jgi:hypothetical protein